MSHKICRIMLRIILLALASPAVFASPWQFELAPYLWATNMNGDVGVGSVKLHVKESFADILKQLDMGAMLYATAHNDNLGFYFNGMYADLSNGEDIDGIRISGKNQFGILGAGISYIVFNREGCDGSDLSLEPYLGFRYTFNDTTLKIADFKFKKDVNWTDPVIGLSLDYNFNRQWGSQLSADVGGTNTTTHYSYSANVFLKYQAETWQHLEAYLGYRLLGQHYEQGSGISFYNWNIKQFGPVLGLGFTF